MEGKARYIFPAVMTAMIVFMVTLLVSALNLGFPPDFLWHLTRVDFVTCPVAGDVGFFAIPVVRRLTPRMVAAIEDRRGRTCVVCGQPCSPATCDFIAAGAGLRSKSIA
ncbi:MAG: DUF2798 domain-containing protein [Pseudorhodoplanes sp.]|nr:MAG: DUF2798 domain-containing protein [Pseudorhodoplanes sp.]